MQWTDINAGYYLHSFWRWPSSSSWLTVIVITAVMYGIGAVIDSSERLCDLSISRGGNHLFWICTHLMEIHLFVSYFVVLSCQTIHTACKLLFLLFPARRAGRNYFLFRHFVWYVSSQNRVLLTHYYYYVLSLLLSMRHKSCSLYVNYISGSILNTIGRNL